MCNHEHYRTRLIKITNQHHIVNETAMYKERFCTECGAVLSRTKCGKGSAELSDFGAKLYGRHMKLDNSVERPDFMDRDISNRHNKQHSGVGGAKVGMTGFRLGYCV